MTCEAFGEDQIKLTDCDIHAVYQEGTHLVIPWFEYPIIYDVRAKPRNIASLTGTKDLQMVNITCRVLSRPAVAELANIYRELGQDYDERVLPSIVNEVLKSVIAQFNASQRAYAVLYQGILTNLRSNSHYTA